MKKIYRTLLVVLLSAGVFSVKAQDTKKEMDDKYVENDVVSLAGKKGFSSTSHPSLLINSCNLAEIVSIEIRLKSYL